MSLFEAIILGVVQGLTEFLPVSSSGHLLLLQRVFGIEEGGLFFTVMLHLATLVAVLIVYRRQVWQLICRPFQKTVLLLVIATLPTVAIALLFKKVAPFDAFYEKAESGVYLGLGFLFTGCLLLLSDLLRRGRKKGRPLHEMTVGDGIAVGCMQAIGVLPGVSRSGSTISGALIAGLNSRAAADFSFLLSIPAIIGGVVLEVPDAIQNGLGDFNIFCLMAGMLAAGFTGYFAIRLVLGAIKKRRMWGFAIYVALLGCVVVFDQVFTHIYF